MPLLPETAEEVDLGCRAGATLTAQAGVILGHTEVVAGIVAQATRQPSPGKLVVEVDTGGRHAGIYADRSGLGHNPHDDAEVVAQWSAVVVEAAQAPNFLRHQVGGAGDVIYGRLVDPADRPAGRHVQIV